MASVILTILGLLVGIAVMAGSAYYLRKDKGDKDSVRIYGIFIAIGAVITIGMVIKIIVAGF